jgi:hypothetical protein
MCGYHSLHAIQTLAKVPWQPQVRCGERWRDQTTPLIRKSLKLQSQLWTGSWRGTMRFSWAIWVCIFELYEVSLKNNELRDINTWIYWFWFGDNPWTIVNDCVDWEHWINTYGFFIENAFTLREGCVAGWSQDAGWVLLFEAMSSIPVGSNI